MKIGILQAGHLPDQMQEEYGDYPQLYEALLDGEGFEFDAYAVVDGAFPNGPEACDGWLVTGSRHGAYEDLPWIPRLEELIRAIHASGRPLVGVCFGHQIIAQALGGKVEKYSKGWSVGPVLYRFADGNRIVHAWHQDQVTEAPPGAEIVASSDFTANAALLYPGHAYTVQPHPEFTDGFLAQLMAARGPGVVPDAQLAEAKAAIGTPLDSDIIARQFAQFLREGTIA